MKKVCIFLLTLLAFSVPVMAAGAETGGHAAGVPFWMCIPFAALLLSIAVFPIVTVREIIDHMHNREIDGEIPLNDEVRERMEKYLEMYCEK